MYKYWYENLKNFISLVSVLDQERPKYFLIQFKI